MRVAIAGAGGMLGQDLVDACVGRGHEVFALPRVRRPDQTVGHDPGPGQRCVDRVGEIRAPDQDDA